MPVTLSSFTIQIGLNFYDRWSVPRIQHAGGNSGNTASFQLALQSGESAPERGQLVSIVYNDTVKLFGGFVAKIKCIRYRPTRVYQIDCTDFTSLTRYKTFSYDSGTEETLEYHLEQLLQLGGGKMPSLIDESAPAGSWVIDRLAAVVRKPLNAPDLVLDVDPSEFRFAVQNVKLDQALTQLCGQAGYRWHVDFGSWLRVDLIAGAVSNLANLILTRNDYTGSNSGIEINVNTPGCADWRGVSTDFTSNDTSRIICARDAESFELAGEGADTSKNHPHQIAADDTRQQYPMLSGYDVLESFTIFY